MKKLVLLAVALLFGLGIYAQTLRVEAKTDGKAEITALENHLIESAKARDLDAIMSSYVPDKSLFVFDVIPPRQYVGAAAYREDWKNYLALFDGPITAEISHVSITTGRDVAFGHSIQHFSGVSTKGGKIDWTFRVTDCYRRIKGKWLIVHEHVSVPVDLPAGKADLASKL